MENYIVSARKYRPETFRSVVGQQHITSTLKNAISRGQLAHAYLFCGPRGVGKTTCARIFAKAINCLSPVDSEACNECESCKGFNEGRSFNIHELDAASNNSVDDIRSLNEQVRIPPQIGRYSVYIIDEVHMLSSAAFNAFLKTLEEPPAHAVFILATTEKHKIIPTILSRCQIFDFNRIRVEDSVGYLRHIAEQEQVTADDQSLHLISMKADGGMRDALSMFDKAVSFCGSELRYTEVAKTLNVLDYDTYFQITGSMLDGDYPRSLLIFDEVIKAGFSPQIFISGLNVHFRDLLMCKTGTTQPLLELSGTLLEQYRSQAVLYDPGFLFDAISLLTTVDGTLRTASNQRLNVELALMKLCGAGQKKNDGPGLTAPEMPLPDKVVSGEAPSLKIQQEKAGKKEIPVEPRDEGNEQKKGSGDQPSDTVEQRKIVPPVEPAAPRPEVETPVATNTPKKPSGKTRTISGNSIASLLNTPVDPNEAYISEENKIEEVVVDPQCGEKIEGARELIIAEINRTRPRIATALRDFTVEGNIIKADVPTEVLYEDIMRNRTEIAALIGEVSGVTGVVDIKLNIREDNSPKKPIKAEDKYEFLLKQNPELANLKRKLGLELE